jgi:putative transposase
MRDKPGYAALRKGRVSIANQIYHITSATRDRVRYFEDFQLARSLIKEFHRQDIETLAFVVMPDHFHWLVQLNDTPKELASYVRSIKCAVTKRYSVEWQKGFYDRAIRKEDDLAAIARYIILNPVRANLVNTVREYPHWDAVWL